MKATDVDKFYKLRQDYEKRTDRYKLFKKWQEEKRKNHDVPVPEQLKERHVFIRPKNWEWLEVHKEELCSYTECGDFISFVERYIDTASESFKEQEGRYPSIQEFKELFVRKLKSMEDDYYSYIVVNFKTDTSTMKKKFSKIILDKRKIKIPDKRLRLDELKQYLEVYDLKESGLSLKEIVARGTYPPDWEVARVVCDRFYRKAKQIIQNVEEGEFPGDYSNVK